MTLEGLNDNYDWAEVFGEGGGGNCTPDVESLDGTDPAQVLRKDVAEIIASVDGDNDGPDWVGVFRMNDGRFLVASGGCDYTGWDCRASNRLTVASSLETAISTGLTPDEALRLGLEHPGKHPEAIAIPPTNS